MPKEAATAAHYYHHFGSILNHDGQLILMSSAIQYGGTAVSPATGSDSHSLRCSTETSVGLLFRNGVDDLTSRDEPEDL